MRNVSLARYTIHPANHDGLKLDRYCHFTSPLRRFPDLVNHLNLHADMSGLPPYYTESDLQRIADEYLRKRMDASKKLFQVAVAA